MEAHVSHFCTAKMAVNFLAFSNESNASPENAKRLQRTWCHRWSESMRLPHMCCDARPADEAMGALPPMMQSSMSLQSHLQPLLAEDTTDSNDHGMVLGELKMIHLQEHRGLSGQVELPSLVGPGHRHI